ncbi:MAG: hypothetical protein ACJAUP_001891 [Cellvibrionaceae bacterium]|jgi:hypothetical protein
MNNIGPSGPRVPAQERKPAASEPKEAQPDSREIHSAETISSTANSDDTTAQQRKETRKHHAQVFEHRINPKRAKIDTLNEQSSEPSATISGHALSSGSPARALNAVQDFSSPQKGIQKLSSEVKETLSALPLRGLGERAELLEVMEALQQVTVGNFAIGGSAALYMHLRDPSTGESRLNDVSLNDLGINDIDAIYTGEGHGPSIELDLKDALSSLPQTKVLNAQGQIALIQIDNFKVDVVPKNEDFGTVFDTVGGMEVASLASLKTAYKNTVNLKSSKSSAASVKLNIIQELEQQKLSPRSEMPASGANEPEGGAKRNLFG